MRTKLLSNLISNIPVIVVILSFLLFSSLRQPEVKKISAPDAAAQCCSGYRIAMAQLRQFMLDSLGSGAFEGGVYSKKDLLKAINSTNGDSVYMMNALLDCLLGKGNGMFITSPTTGTVQIVSKNPYCAPCPQRACCPQKICAARINRSCINYKQLFENIAISENTDIDVSVSK